MAGTAFSIRLFTISKSTERRRKKMREIGHLFCLNAVNPCALTEITINNFTQKAIQHMKWNEMNWIDPISLFSTAPMWDCVRRTVASVCAQFTFYSIWRCVLPSHCSCCFEGVFRLVMLGQKATLEKLNLSQTLDTIYWKRKLSHFSGFIDEWNASHRIPNGEAINGPTDDTFFVQIWALNRQFKLENKNWRSNAVTRNWKMLWWTVKKLKRCCLTVCHFTCGRLVRDSDLSM